MTPIVEMQKSQCPKCGSTERTEYNQTRAPMVVGGTKDGKKFNAVVWRRTTCKVCGQARIDKCYEFLSTINSPETGQSTNHDSTAEKPTKTSSEKQAKVKKKPK